MATRLQRCVVCREPALPPVVMPCDGRHQVCLECFEHIEEASNMTCPMCRKRLNAWARKLKMNVVDKELWEELIALYPAECARRFHALPPALQSLVQAPPLPPPSDPDPTTSATHRGKDADGTGNAASSALLAAVESDEEDALPRRVLAETGEVRREYEAMLQQVQVQLQQEQQEELAASLPLLEEAREEQRMAAARASLEEADREFAMREQERLAREAAQAEEADRILAQKLQADLAAAQLPSIQRTTSHDSADGRGKVAKRSSTASSTISPPSAGKKSKSAPTKKPERGLVPIDVFLARRVSSLQNSAVVSID